MEEYKVIEGFHVKTRIWAKPKSKVNSLRKIACGLDDIEDENGGDTPNNDSEDVYSRVIVETKEKYRFGTL